MIGDRCLDIEAAQDNDIQSIAVMWGYGSSEELMSHHPNFIASDIDELQKIITEA
jgi:phosphoglycolate phosphatase